VKSRKYLPKIELIVLVDKTGLPRHVLAARLGMAPSTFQAKLIGYCPISETECGKIIAFCKSIIIKNNSDKYAFLTAQIVALKQEMEGL
jgi:hypothetical protein